MYFKKVTIITGHYGCGKTNIATNIALDIARTGKTCTVVDLDIVNPYFRTADFKKMFEKMGIKLVAPIYANTNLDIPAMNFNLTSILINSDYVVIDVGGDDAGAMALGVHHDYLNNRDDVEMLYVINKYRLLTEDIDNTIELMRDIESCSRVKCTGIVNNSNLGLETYAETVLDSLEYADEVCKKALLPLEFTTFNKDLKVDIEKKYKPYPMDIYVKTLWNMV